MERDGAPLEVLQGTPESLVDRKASQLRLRSGDLFGEISFQDAELSEIRGGTE